MIFQLNAVLLNFLFRESWKNVLPLQKKIKNEAAQVFSTLIKIRNVSWAANQHIRMISEESCDTEDWSNDDENSALITEINYILLYIQIENSYFKM